MVEKQQRLKTATEALASAGPWGLKWLQFQRDRAISMDIYGYLWISMDISIHIFVHWAPNIQIQGDEVSFLAEVLGTLVVGNTWDHSYLACKQIIIHINSDDMFASFPVSVWWKNNPLWHPLGEGKNSNGTGLTSSWPIFFGPPDSL